MSHNHEPTGDERQGLMTFDVSPRMLDLIRHAQNSPEHLNVRNITIGLAASIKRGSTDASEASYRAVHYQVAKTLLAMAGGIMDEAVQGGMDLKECSTANDMLLFAVALASYVIAVMPDKGGEQ